MENIRIVQKGKKQYLYLPNDFTNKTHNILFFKLGKITYICPDTKSWRDFISDLPKLPEEMEHAKLAGKY